MRSDIFFCGDTHGNFDHVIKAVQVHKPVGLIFLGDLQAQQPLHNELRMILDKTDIWWVPGNHDTDSDADYDNLFGSSLALRNLHGQVVEVAGVRIAGLGGVFRGRVWSPPGDPVFASPDDLVQSAGRGNLWRNGLTRQHRSTIFPVDYASLMGQRADVLVSHEAPSVHQHGWDAVDALASSLRVRKSFHGHHHDRQDYSRHWDALGFEAHGVGFCGITALDGTVIRAGDFDDCRMMLSDVDPGFGGAV